LAWAFVEVAPDGSSMRIISAYVESLKKVNQGSQKVWGFSFGKSSGWFVSKV